MSGEVSAIVPKRMPNGIVCDCVVIKNDFKDEAAPLSVPGEELTASELSFEAGIVGMGGATFPTHIKLSVPEGKKAECVLINGSECEPYITSDHRVLLERGEGVFEGLKLVMKKLGAEKGFIAIEKNKADAIGNMKRICKDAENISVIPLETKYPQGSEKQLIDAVLGKKVPGGRGLPIDAGCVVLNVDTVSAIYRYASFGKPLISRIVTVSGECVKNPANFEVRIGTPMEYVLENAGGLISEVQKIIMGGPMMGTALPGLDFPVTKGCGALLFFGEQKMGESLPCIRCGRCIDACPMGLSPHNLCNLSSAKLFDECEKYFPFDCIECGACTYVCPSKRYITQYIKLCKQKLRDGGTGGRK